MNLSPQQRHRAAGVLVGQACGDALGVPYEFAATPREEPRMVGGGLGPYAPGEWSDDTQMAVCIAKVAATGADLTSPAALDDIASAFLAWRSGGATDVGVQTRQVLRATVASGTTTATAMLSASRDLHRRTGRTAGNGGLMRTAVVGLTRLDDRDATAASARAVAELTHADPLAGDSCVIWADLARHAVLTGHLEPFAPLDLLPPSRRDRWRTWLTDAVDGPYPAAFSPNGFTVTALQAALAAVVVTRTAGDGPARFRNGLIAAVRAGDDTDTVAAITGVLLGALEGASAVPFAWRRVLHGWPGLRADDLVSLALRTAGQGCLRGRGWPEVETLRAGYERPLARPHPHDDGVLLGTYADLLRTDELGVDAVVSLCRVGRDELGATRVAPGDHHRVWLVDSERPDDNPHLEQVLDDAAAAVAAFRSEGKRVLLHCVAAEQRTPSVAVRYSVRYRRIAPRDAAGAIRAALPSVRGSGRLWETAIAAGVASR